MLRPQLPLSGFRSFESAARWQSFARAAEELCVTPAAISHQVRALEDYLGVKLFVRTGRTVHLTEAGRELLPELSAGFERMEAGLRRVRAARVEPGVVTVTMPPSFAAKWFVPRLEAIRAALPDVDVRVDTATRLVDFEADEIDLAIRYGLGGYEGAESVELFREEVFPVCAPVLAKTLRRPDDLSGVLLIHDETTGKDPNFPDWRAWLAAAGAEGVDHERGLRFRLSSMAVQAAIDGQGVVLGRRVLVADDLEAGRLERPFATALPAEPSYWLVMPIGPRSAGAEALRGWLLREAGACTDADQARAAPAR